MSDFLDRLAQRALGLAPVVRPVIRSVFAPASGVAPAAEPPTGLAGTPGGLAEPASPASAPRRSRRDDDEPAGARPNAARQPAPPGDIVTERAIAVPIVVEAGARWREARRATPDDHAVDTRDAATEGPDAAPAPAPGPRVTGLAPPPIRPARAVSPVSAPAAARRAPPLAPGRDADGEDTSGAPTIHVTIGRIEVRAVAPPSPPAKPVRPTPALSLGEYLRQQHGKAAP